MAPDIANGINWYLSVAPEHREYLGAIRHWNNLRMAVEEDRVWVKDFTEEQVGSVEVKRIPYKKVYYGKEGRLFLQGSLVPDRRIPSVLWTPIERVLPLKLPAMNHNFFGITDRLVPRLVASPIEKEAFGLLTTVPILGRYIESAPAIRLKSLSWVLVNEDQAFILGCPLLPIEGRAYWRQDHFLLPAGYELQWPSLTGALNQQLNAEGRHWIIWDAQGRYFKLAMDFLRPLSISSFRRTLSH